MLIKDYAAGAGGAGGVSASKASNLSAVALARAWRASSRAWSSGVMVPGEDCNAVMVSLRNLTSPCKSVMAASWRSLNAFCFAAKSDIADIILCSISFRSCLVAKPESNLSHSDWLNSLIRSPHCAF